MSHHKKSEPKRKDQTDLVTERGASTRAETAKECNYVGNYDAALSALAPYLSEIHGQHAPNEQLIAESGSARVRGDLMVEIALLMNNWRSYQAATNLLEKAIALYHNVPDSLREANAYHWLAFTKLNQHKFQESERCDLKAIELLYQRANRQEGVVDSIGKLRLSHAVAKSRIWLGILAQRQGLLMKAKTELYTAKELMQAAGDEEGRSNDYRAWGDLCSSLGRVYSCEGRYDDAIDETKKAIDFYAQAGHLTFQVQTRINLARIYIKKMQSRGAAKGDAVDAKRHLNLAADIFRKEFPRGDLRTECLRDLTYSWYYFACGDWPASKRTAEAAIRSAKRLGSNSLLADSYRARADAIIQLHQYSEGRANLNAAMEFAISVSQHKSIGAILLSFARSYCSHVDPDPAEVDKYLDRFLEIRSNHVFESRYLDDLMDDLKQKRLELPSQRAFYFSIDDLQAGGYDAGLSRYLVWAVRSARLLSHGEMKKMTDVLQFNSLSRTYKYEKLARLVESGINSAARTINKTHTIHSSPNSLDNRQVRSTPAKQRGGDEETH